MSTATVSSVRPSVDEGQAVPTTPVPGSSVLKRTRACLECGREFPVNACHATAHRFCRPACRARNYRRGRLARLIAYARSLRKEAR
jgi:hypothetical protein